MIGLTGFKGYNPLIYYSTTGVQGYSTGKTFSQIEEGLWEDPVKEVLVDGSIYYRVDQYYHCAFGPAVITNKRIEWYIKGNRLSGRGVEITQAILSDIKLAPLYVNDPFLKYSAKYMLENYKKETW